MCQVRVAEIPDDQILFENAPHINELNFRHFRGESDYVPLAKVLTDSDKADQIEREVSAEAIAKAFEHLVNCDPYKDMIIVEVAGEMVGYLRGWWREESPTKRLYHHNGFLVAGWRRVGIGLVMLRWMENRLKEITADHPPDQGKFYQVSVSQFQGGTVNLLVRVGYIPVRYFYEMVRPNLDGVPESSLPKGLEIRPVIHSQYPAIWKSIDETSQEEWGYTPPNEEAYQEWLAGPHFQPHLWQIAWDTEVNQVVGHVLTYIDDEENKQMNRKRGYTEGIGVHPAWRRRGLANGLIHRSLRNKKPRVCLNQPWLLTAIIAAVQPLCTSVVVSK